MNREEDSSLVKSVLNVAASYFPFSTGTPIKHRYVIRLLIHGMTNSSFRLS